MVVAISRELGLGIYTPSEAAYYARVPTQLLNRWMFGNRRGERVIAPQRGSDNKVITFLDWVQTLGVRAIRKQANVPLQKIREAIATAQQHYGVEFPLAQRHITVFGDELVIKVDEEYVGTTGGLKHNRMFREIVEFYQQDLAFGDDGLASSHSWKWQDQAVTMNPKFRFGEPIVGSTGITAETLSMAVSVEGSVDAAAEVHGVDRNDVLLAVRYIDYLDRKETAA